MDDVARDGDEDVVRHVLLREVAHHHLAVDALVEKVREERARLDEVVGSRPDARAYLEQLEAAGPATSVPPGEDIAAEVERFLRETTGDPRNPFEGPPPDRGNPFEDPPSELR